MSAENIGWFAPDSCLGIRFRNGVVAVLLGVAVGSTIAGLPTRAGAKTTSWRRPLVALTDGFEDTRFVGSLRVENQIGSDEEVLTFRDGEFASRICRKYGYPPASYWVRRDAEGLHFFANLENPDNGTIRFEGVFDGATMRATARWTKERWYWTVEETLRFSGRPDATPE